MQEIIDWIRRKISRRTANSEIHITTFAHALAILIHANCILPSRCDGWTALRKNAPTDAPSSTYWPISMQPFLCNFELRENIYFIGKMLYGRNCILVETALSIRFSFAWILFTANDICEHCVWSYFFRFVSKHLEPNFAHFAERKKKFAKCNVCRFSSAQLASVAYHTHQHRKWTKRLPPLSQCHENPE